ncbi:molecular chaperone HtpG [Mucilaginibacter gossypiicola]|uniref:Molecular chaperone HtpG n=1 Tax=Mucilaginibacter gossypiicola TaxID=551995 RepID=A0A1H8DB89_9SPHI|nr:ATP-binding protein [Mucilaginibacter gossypiicola]SEN03747.1 molecular chaperone HtpG [Mucilaginibacter gossypiicola]
MSNSSKLSFQIEVKRILEILSNDIYDSPYALLRENIQNGYDAVLMRKQLEGDSFEPMIEVEITSSKIVITDNGIGMNEDVIQNNFWKAGSSGKNNETARKAGVVGTFGIGAMANFGVCTSIEVITHYAGGDLTIRSFANRDTLSITEECIDVMRYQEKREPGTTIIATLDDSLNLTVTGAINYLSPYIRYLQIPVLINGKNVSQSKYYDSFKVESENLSYTTKKSIVTHDKAVQFNLTINLTNQNIIKILCENITRDGVSIVGNIVLSQGGGGIYGLRNFFGLAPVPIAGSFNFGGVVNLSNLHPTAGREALSRESIEFVSKIVFAAEYIIAKELSELELSDLNSGFLNYISANKRYDFAKKLKIVVQPNNERWNLEKIQQSIDGKKVYYYSGRDQSTILQFGNENTYLLLISQENPRRRIQLEYIKNLKIEEVPDGAQVLEEYELKNLSMEELTLILRITNVLTEDYLIADVKVVIAKISHDVPSLVTRKDKTVNVFISRTSPAVKQVLQIYKTEWSLFASFVKDFVRNHLYQKFSNYVPSSTKEGADALQQILMKNKELYKYDSADMGKVESLLSDFATGEMPFAEVIKKSNTITRTHRQYVRLNQIGSVEEEIPSIIDEGSKEEDEFDEFDAVPPILRLEVNTDKKILKTDNEYPSLNFFNLFLSLSEKVVKSNRDFFLEPHTTKVIWSMHKIVYIFTHASNQLSLYYEIELKERLGDNSTGGKAIPTTTVVTENRVFIPIVKELNPYFEISSETTKEFFVRYDVIADFNTVGLRP